MTDPSGDVLNEKIVNLQHLNAVIQETLRLHPPVPSLIQRKTPPEGIVIDGTVIPGNMIISCPQYVIGRSESTHSIFAMQ
jgi:tryprostatin B 6-hydroxylase